MAIAIITGASSGIGREFVRQIANDNELDEIWVLARRVDRLAELQHEISKKLIIKGVDFNKRADMVMFSEELKVASPEVKLLINCAGLGYIGEFDKLSANDNVEMIDVNCTALTYMTHIVLPFIIDGGRIINLASSAAYLPQPKFAVYAATKSYVLSLSRALGRELRKRNIKVTAVCPGPVKTEFFDLAERKFKGASYKEKFMVSADKVVKSALKASKKGKAVVTYSFSMKFFRLICKVLPKKWLLGFVK